MSGGHVSGHCPEPVLVDPQPAAEDQLDDRCESHHDPDLPPDKHGLGRTQRHKQSGGEQTQQPLAGKVDRGVEGKSDRDPHQDHRQRAR